MLLENVDIPKYVVSLCVNTHYSIILSIYYQFPNHQIGGSQFTFVKMCVVK